MVEVGIHSIKKQDVIKKIARVFPNVLFFVGCPTTEWRISAQYSVFFCKKRNKNTREEQDQNPQSHSEYYAPLKTFLLYSVPFRPPPLLYLPRGPGKLSSATVKQSDQANSINPEHLFFMIVDNLVVLLLCSCLF